MSMDNSKCVLFSLHMLFTLLMAVTHPADLPCCHPRAGRAVTALLHRDNKSHVLICQVDEFVKGFFGAGLDTGKCYISVLQVPPRSGGFSAN